MVDDLILMWYIGFLEGLKHIIYEVANDCEWSLDFVADALVGLNQPHVFFHFFVN